MLEIQQLALECMRFSAVDISTLVYMNVTDLLN